MTRINLSSNDIYTKMLIVNLCRVFCMSCMSVYRLIIKYGLLKSFFLMELQSLQLINAKLLACVLEDLRYEVHGSHGNEGFHWNRVDLLAGFKENRLYILHDPTQFHAHMVTESLFGMKSEYEMHYVPSFLLKGDTYRDRMLWVRADMRGRGHGRFMMQRGGFTSIYATPGTSKFWRRCNFVRVGSSRRMDLIGATGVIDIRSIDRRTLLFMLIQQTDEGCAEDEDIDFDVDFFHGVSVKADLSSDAADPQEYDRVHGDGAFARVVTILTAA